MVDVGGKQAYSPYASLPRKYVYIVFTVHVIKQDSIRKASASGSVRLGQEAYQLVAANQIKKGDVLRVAQIAGIMAAKRTSDLIPLCHNIALHRFAQAFCCET